MKNTHNATIASLAVSAAILLAVLLTLHLAGPAAADTSISGGDYILITGAYSEGTDLVYLIDVQAQRLNVYRFNRTKDTISLIDQVNLRLAFR